MPSLAAKSENKISNSDADAVKQVHLMMEKRIRNLEKRKMKLDNYRQDVKNGKELNEDQKIAVSKYDEVEYVLEFMRDLYKSAQTVVQDSIRSQKKQAKKENVERQQHEIQRLQEAFIYRHMLSQFENEDVRNDFLNGENGAIKLTSEQLSQLDQLYKSIGPGLPTDQADTSHHFHKLAENFIFLVEGKNKEIVGTTYKVLKDLLLSIKECGYFSKPSQVVDEDGPSSEGVPEDEVTNASDQNQEILTDDHISNDDIEQPQSVEQPNEEVVVDVPVPKSPEETPIINETPKYQNGPLQEVLSAQGAFNFLQESQIDLNAPHMDPAVVAVHQMVPPQPTSVNFTGNAYPASPPVEGKIPVNGSENCELPSPVSPLSQVPVLPAAMPHTVAPVLSSVQLNSQQEFDPSHPIPTQTFTNQSFAVMQNMILPQGYVPVTMHHGPMPHMTPVAVVPGLSTPVTTGAAAVPIPVPVAPVSVTPAVNNEDDTELKSETEEIMKLPEENGNSYEAESNGNNVSHEKNGENGYNSFRGFRRGRARGNNGYYRGRSNYNGRGGYNHYYQDRNGYNGNYRRGNYRGSRGNGNNRGRGNGNGNYRTQGSSQQSQQQQQVQQ